jgi:hypothetical protein
VKPRERQLWANLFTRHEPARCQRPTPTVAAETSVRVWPSHSTRLASEFRSKPHPHRSSSEHPQPISAAAVEHSAIEQTQEAIRAPLKVDHSQSNRSRDCLALLLQGPPRNRRAAWRGATADNHRHAGRPRAQECRRAWIHRRVGELTEARPEMCIRCQRGPSIHPPDPRCVRTDCSTLAGDALAPSSVIRTSDFEFLCAGRKCHVHLRLASFSDVN